jgi:hypothetical protein
VKVEAEELKMAMIESSSSNPILTRVSAAFASLSSHSFSMVMPEMCEIERYFRVVMFAIAMARSCADITAFARCVVFLPTYKLE